MFLKRNNYNNHSFFINSFFENIDGLTKKGNSLYINDKLFGTFFPDNDLDKTIYQGAIEVKMEDEQVIKALEMKDYLLIYNRDYCCAK